MKPRLRVSGMKDLDRRLAGLDRVSRREVVTAALMEGGEVIAELARGFVPVRTGQLRDSIAVGERAVNYSSGRARRGKSEVYVGPVRGGKSDGFHGHLVEFGTIHMAAQPFMRPAFDVGAARAQAVVTTRLSAELASAAKG